MPRKGLTFAALALGLSACGQNPPSAPASSAGPGRVAPPQSATPPGFTGAPYAASRTFFKLQGRYPSAWFICDGIDRPVAMIVGLPDVAGNLTIITLDKTRPGHHGQASFKVGSPDPGAGQIYWPLTGAGGAEAGYLRAFNPGMIDDPKSATTATFTEIKIGDVVTSCRWTPHAVVQALGAHRSYLVTREAGQLVYRTFNYDQAAAVRPLPDPGPTRTTAPSLEIHGGAEAATKARRLYIFENEGYRYTVEVGELANPHGGVLVTKADRQVGAEPFEAYTIAR